MNQRIEDMTEPQLKRYFRDLALTIEGELPPGPSRKGRCLFVLLVCDESSIGQYVSNAARPEIIKLLRETADRLEKREDLPR